MAKRTKPQTVELWIYMCYGVAGAGANELGVVINTANTGCLEKAIEDWKESCYWAISFEDSPGFPDVFCNMYFEGSLPSDRGRDRIASHIQALLGTTIFGQDPMCPECHSQNVGEIWAMDITPDGWRPSGELYWLCEDCGWSFSVQRHV